MQKRKENPKYRKLDDDNRNNETSKNKSNKKNKVRFSCFQPNQKAIKPAPAKKQSPPIISLLEPASQQFENTSQKSIFNSILEYVESYPSEYPSESEDKTTVNEPTDLVPKDQDKPSTSKPSDGSSVISANEGNPTSQNFGQKPAESKINSNKLNPFYDTPNASTPGASKPGASKTSASNPGAIQPDARPPGASKTVASNPGAIQPGASKPGASKTVASNPSAIQPSARPPGASKTVGSYPGANKPGANKPVAPKPVAPKPVAPKPVAIKLVAPKTSAIKPAASNPGTSKPIEARTTKTQPVATKPVDKKPIASKLPDNKPAVTRRFDERPIGTKPIGDKPIATKSIDNKPLETKPIATKHFDDRPSETKRFDNKPIVTNPFYDTPIETKDENPKPLSTKPNLDQNFDKKRSDQSADKFINALLRSVPDNIAKSIDAETLEEKYPPSGATSYDKYPGSIPTDAIRYYPSSKSLDRTSYNKYPGFKSDTSRPDEGVKPIAVKASEEKPTTSNAGYMKPGTYKQGYENPTEFKPMYVKPTSTYRPVDSRHKILGASSTSCKPIWSKTTGPKAIGAKPAAARIGTKLSDLSDEEPSTSISASKSGYPLSASSRQVDPKQVDKQDYSKTRQPTGATKWGLCQPILPKSTGPKAIGAKPAKSNIDVYDNKINAKARNLSGEEPSTSTDAKPDPSPVSTTPITSNQDSTSPVSSRSVSPKPVSPKQISQKPTITKPTGAIKSGLCQPKRRGPKAAKHANAKMDDGKIHDATSTSIHDKTISPKSRVEKPAKHVSEKTAKPEREKNYGSKQVVCKPIFSKTSNAKPTRRNLNYDLSTDEDTSISTDDTLRPAYQETKPADTKPVDAKQLGVKPIDVTPVDTKPIGATSFDTKPISVTPVDPKLIGATPVDTRPTVGEKNIVTIPSDYNSQFSKTPSAFKAPCINFRPSCKPSSSKSSGVKHYDNRNIGVRPFPDTFSQEIPEDSTPEDKTIDGSDGKIYPDKPTENAMAVPRSPKVSVDKPNREIKSSIIKPILKPSENLSSDRSLDRTVHILDYNKDPSQYKFEEKPTLIDKPFFRSSEESVWDKYPKRKCKYKVLSCRRPEGDLRYDDQMPRSIEQNRRSSEAAYDPFGTENKKKKKCSKLHNFFRRKRPTPQPTANDAVFDVVYDLVNNVVEDIENRTLIAVPLDRLLQDEDIPKSKRKLLDLVDALSLIAQDEPKHPTGVEMLLPPQATKYGVKVSSSETTIISDHPPQASKEKEMQKVEKQGDEVNLDRLLASIETSIPEVQSFQPDDALKIPEDDISKILDDVVSKMWGISVPRIRDSDVTTARGIGAPKIREVTGISEIPQDAPQIKPKDSLDSLIQFKLREDMDNESITQYFAIRSLLNLDAYLNEARRVEEEKKKIDARVSLDHSSAHSLRRMPFRNLSTVSWDAARKYSSTNLIRLMSRDSIQSDIDFIPTRGRSDVHISASEPEVKHGKRICKKCRRRKRSSIKLMEKSSEENLAWNNVDEIKEEVKEEQEEEKKEPSNGSVSYEFIDPSKQALTLFLAYIMPTDALLQYAVSFGDGDSQNEFIFKWNFLQHEDSFIFTLDDLETKPLDYYQTYSFDINDSVYLYLQKCPIPIEIFVVQDGVETILGKCNLRLSRALQGIQRVYESVLDINNNDLCVCYSLLKPVHLGTLTVRYSFRGDPGVFDKCIPVKPVLKQIPVMGNGSFESLLRLSTDDNMKRRSTMSLSVPGVNDSELIAFQDGLNLVLVRNKALRTTQAEITNELKERTTWMHEELKWRLTLQENAILSGKDPNSVKWRQWKDETTANVKYRPLANPEFVKENKAEIEITILELHFNSDCRVLSDESITQIYMEYSFLHYSGPSMETVCKKKPEDDQAIIYNFQKKFTILREEKEAKMLAEMIKNNEVITFSVVSQPVEDLIDLQSCCEIGHAQINLFDLLQQRGDVIVDYYPLVDEYYKVEIGTVKIKFQGILSVRSLALNILTPEYFKIIR